MANNQPKDEALEALDFVVNVLKEHEKDLDRLINELATVTDQLGNTGELSGKVEKVEEKINSLQKEVTNLVSYLSGIEKKEGKLEGPKEQKSEPARPVIQALGGPSLVLQCKQWEDFQVLAYQAQTLSFNYKEDEKMFQADALKGSQVVTYVGCLPKFSAILKSWLSKQLDVPEKNILEGILVMS